MSEHRCPCCKRLLMTGDLIEVQIKCPKCKKIVRLQQGRPFKKIDFDGEPCFVVNI